MGLNLTQEQGYSIAWTIVLSLFFGFCTLWGWLEPPAQVPSIRAGVILSALAWLAAAIQGMWSPERRHLSAVLNGLAASMAAFAGLAALAGL